MRNPRCLLTIVLTSLALLAAGCSSSSGGGAGSGDAGGKDVGKADAVSIDKGGSDTKANADKGAVDPGPGADPGVGDTASTDTVSTDTAGADTAGADNAVGDTLGDAATDSGTDSDVAEDVAEDVADDASGDATVGDVFGDAAGDAVEEVAEDTIEDAGGDTNTDSDATAVACTTATDCAGQISLGPCETAACDGGFCAAVAKGEGDGCDDGDFCTENDVCTGGACAGTPVANCSTGADCSDPIEVTALPFTFSADTTGVSNDFDAEGCAGIDPSFSGTGSSDMIFSFTAPAAGLYTFELAKLSPGVDAILGIFDVCPSDPAAVCADAADFINSPSEGGGESLTQTLTSGQTVYVLVDGYSNSDNQSGPFELHVSRSEDICDDNLDNDDDSLTDCADPDCASLAVCPAAGDTCADPVVLSGASPITVLGTTDHPTLNHDYSGTDCSADGSGDTQKDVVYSFTPPASGRYRISLDKSGTDFDAQIYIATTCPPTKDSCLGVDDSVGNGGEEIITDLGAGTAYIFVDGWSASSPDNNGKFTLVVEVLESLCDDKIDNDNDGKTDCDDLDCADVATCSAPGDACVTAIPALGSLPLEISGTTDLPNLHANYSADSCDANLSSDGAKEAVYSFTAAGAGAFSFTLVPDDPNVVDDNGTDYNSRLYVSSACAPTEAACLGVADASGDLGGEKVIVDGVASGDTLFIFVDGVGSYSPTSGGYKLRIAHAETACADGADNDGDGSTDCGDDDCVKDAACLASGDICDDPVVIDAGAFPYSGDTSQFTNLSRRADCDASASSSSGSAAAETVHSFTAAELGKYTFTLTPTTSGFDSVLYVSSSCPIKPDVCLGGSDKFSDPESVTVTLQPGETVFLVVDGFSSGDEGAYDLDLSIESVESVCDDNLDNDSDTFTDCQDDDCATDPACSGQGDLCSSAIAMAGLSTFTATGDTSDLMTHDNYDSAMCGTSGSTNSSDDMVYAFTPASDGTYRFKLDKATAFDTVLYLATACPPTTDACLGIDDKTGDGGELIEAALTAGEPVYVFVDGFAGDTGTYSLTVEGIEELCDDNTDNDDDSLTDCDDSDCKLAVNCVQAGEVCEKPLELSGALPITATGDTALFADAYEPCTGTSTYDSPEVVYAFQAPAAGDYVFSLNPAGTDYDSYLFLSSGCPPTTDNCLGTDDAFPGNGGESIQVTLAMGERVYIYVDAFSFSGGASGSFQLEVKAAVQ